MCIGGGGAAAEEGYRYCKQLAALERSGRRAERSLPEELRGITTPLQAEYWADQLREHPDSEFVSLILRGIRHGFRIGFQEDRVSLIARECNMRSAELQETVVKQYLQDELRLGRIAEVGTVEEAAILGVHVSPFGVIPKKNKPNKWRLILDLSAPAGASVNDGIVKEQCSLTYVSVDQVASRILELGRGTTLAKMDVQQAYRQVPVFPQDRLLLGIGWKGKVYVDKVLPFGLRSAPMLFTAIADALQWVMEKNGTTYDFLTMGPPATGTCSRNMSVILETFNNAGLPIDPAKTEGPATTITFLGLEVDSIALEVRLPREKLENLKQLLRGFRGRKACRKRELLSLIGSLSHACKAVRSGRAFLRRLIDLSCTVRQLDHFVRLSVSAKSDIEWWFQFAENWNGIAMMQNQRAVGSSMVLTSDASGGWGCGAFYRDKWFQLPWNEPVRQYHITVKELIPIVVAAALWGTDWTGEVVKVRCDNAAVVACINKESSKEREVMHLLRCLVFIAARYQFQLHAIHLPGTENRAADALSRDQLTVFRSMVPQAAKEPAVIPPELLDLLLVTKPDWTMWQWTDLWTHIFKMDYPSQPEGLTTPQKTVTGGFAPNYSSPQPQHQNVSSAALQRN